MRAKLNSSKGDHGSRPGTLSYFPYKVTSWYFPIPGRKLSRVRSIFGVQPEVSGGVRVHKCT